MILKVKDIALSSYIGFEAIQKIEQEIIKYKNKNYSEIVVDFREFKFSLKDEYLPEIAKLIEYYNVSFLGLESKEDEINRILNSGYFLKKKLGAENYARLFLDLVAKADFPLLIRDNKYKKDVLAPYSVVQPLYFDSSYFYFKTIKTYLLEPIYLEKACWHSDKKESIWNEDKILISDLGNEKTIIRFPANQHEKTLLDIFSNIISGDLSLLTLKWFFFFFVTFNLIV